ncbi:hypothetical protein GN958_ATG11810 [Phytophthora infestans]|uniref:Uncharacterized protein n=1 Tax=Phytophthora infestans TaxID=4787 RepID=A0A8S9UIH6_PHYIN|nr:hypothetical protein GN958_ATG11810 [Phytophthora infestans]
MDQSKPGAVSRAEKGPVSEVVEKNLHLKFDGITDSNTGRLFQSDDPLYAKPSNEEDANEKAAKKQAGRAHRAADYAAKKRKTSVKYIDKKRTSIAKRSNGGQNATGEKSHYRQKKQKAAN